MPLMVRPEGGSPVDVPDAEVRLRESQGWTMAPGQTLRRIVGSPSDATGEVELIEADLTTEAYNRLTQTRGTLVMGLGDNLGDLPAMELVRAQREQRAQQARIADIGQEGVFGRAALSTLTFGLSEAAGARLAEDPELYRQVIGEAQEAYPGADFAGTLAGFVLPAVTPLGWGRALAGAGGAGLQAGRVAARGAARLGAGGTGQAIARGLVDGGVGGALYAVQVANETADYENLSERMVAEGLLGAAIGGGVEGLIGGVGALRRSAQGAAELESRSQNALMDTLRDTTDAGVLRQLRGRLEEILSGVNLDQMRLPRTGRSLRDPEVLDGVARVRQNEGRYIREISDVVEGSVDLQRRAVSALRNSHKNTRLRGAASAVPEAEVAGALSRVRGAVDQAEEAFVLSPRLARQAGGNRLQRAIKAAKAAQKAPTKQRVQRLMDARDELVELRGTYKVDQVELNDIATHLQRTIDDELTNLPSFGDLFALRKQAVDHATENLAQLRKIFGGDGEVMNPASVRAVLEKMGRGEAGDLEKAFAAILAPNRIDDVVEAGLLPKDFVTSGGPRLTTKELDTVVRDFEARALYERALRQVNQESGLGATLGIGGGAGIAAAIGGGFMVGGLPGAAIGAAGSLIAASLTKPLGFARGMNNLRNVFRSQDARLQKASRVVEGRIAGETTASGFSGLTARSGSIAAVWLEGSEADKARVYDQVASRVEELVANPEAFMAEWQQHVDGAQILNEQLPSQMTLDGLRGLQTLMSLMPPGRRGRNQMRLPTIQIPPSRTEQDAFLEAAAVVEDPVFGVELLAAGVLSNQGARAMENAYPRLFQQMAQQVFASYSESVSRGGQVDYQTATQLSTYLGIPLERSMDPSFIVSMQESYSQTSAQERAIRSPQTVQREVGNLVAANHSTMGTRLMD